MGVCGSKWSKLMPGLYPPSPLWDTLAPVPKEDCDTDDTSWPTRDTPALEGLTMNIAAWVERNGRVFADRPGISVGLQVHATYAQWAARVRAIAGGLAALPGLAPGERVAIAMTNRAEYLEALFGIWHAGLF